ncbi:MAG: EAL domain-containing protein [Geminicoccales bacterium]
MASKLTTRQGKRPSCGQNKARNNTSTDGNLESSQASNEAFRRVVKIAPDGVVIHQGGRIIFANHVAAEQYGANDPSEIIGCSGLDFVAPADHQRMVEFVEQINIGKGGQSKRAHFQRMHFDGSLVDVEVLAMKIEWGGKPAILNMVRDISVHVQADARLQDFLSTATRWLWETDVEHRFTYISDFNQGNLVSAQIIGKTRWELGGLMSDPNERWQAHMADLEARRPFRDFEYQSATEAWRGRYLSISGMPVFDVHGAFKGYRGTTRDITKQKMAELALRESEQRFKLALEGARGGVFDIDLVSGKITYDEQSALMLGYDRADEIPGELADWMDRLHPDDREAARTRLDEFLEGKSDTLLSEQRQRTKSGGWIWFSCIGKVVERNADGHPLRLLGVRFDITERKQAEQLIEHMALHDALTKLPNRIYFTSELERACFAAKRDGTKLAVLFLDLDHFKDINDAHGHTVGDKLLVEVASRLKSCLRGGDLVARFGGDEFVMVVSQPHGAVSISCLADRITKIIEAPCEIDDFVVNTSISIGVAIYPDDGIDAERILANADLALYKAKSDGRHTWRVFDCRLQRQLQAQRSLDQELRHALERQQFELHYQPIIGVADDRIRGFEALIRWNHPERGQILPEAFVPATERNRLIVPLTEWVLQEATTQLQSWPSNGPAEYKIAVNVSPIMLKLQGFTDLVDRCLATTDCDPRRLVIEITEEALVEEARVISVLIALRQRGVTIAIDDFGTGYSSMARLKSLPIDILKIDRSFLANVADDANDATIVESLVNVGHGLGKNVVAEGVETAEQLRFLEAIGCDTAQGFFINRAMVARDIPRWSEQWQSTPRCCGINSSGNADLKEASAG